MCFFVSAILPPEASCEALADVFARHGRECRPIVDAGALPEPGAVFVATTRGHCDCGTVLGSALRGAGRRRRGEERALAKLQAKGWSAARIERWLRERDRSARRDERAPAGHARRGPSAAQYVALLREVVERGAPYAGLHLRWGSGRVEPRERLEVPLDSLTEDALLALPEDVLLIVRRGAAGRTRA